MMQSIKELVVGKEEDPDNPPPVPDYPEKDKLTHEMYNFIHARCFDACIDQFNHKILLNSEI